MKKRLLILLSNLIIVSSLTGCFNAIPELSDEDEDLVVRYMADSVLAADINYSSRLLSDEEVDGALAEESKKAEKLKQIEEEELKNKEEKKKENTPDDIEVEITPSFNRVDDINDYLELEGIEFEYKDYIIADKYPDNNEDFIFSLTSAQGSDLLVLEMNVSNVSGEDKYLDLLSVSEKYRVTINDSIKCSAAFTPLENDINNFEGELKKEQVVTLVAVFEIPDETTIDKLDLTVSDSNKETVKINLI